MVDDTTSKLLAGSRSLQALISDATDLPPVSRSIHQIAEQSGRMLAATGAPAAPAAATQRFLAQHGVEAADLDPHAFEISRPEGAEVEAGLLDPREDMEAFLEAEQQRIMHEVILETNQLIMDDFDASMWEHLRREHEADRPRLLESLRFEAGRYDAAAEPMQTGGPVALPALAPPAAAAPGQHALGRSRVRSARSVAFAGRLSALWDATSKQAGGGGDPASVRAADPITTDCHRLPLIATDYH